MKNLNARPIRLTTAQFAQLHGINKRTLHYYDAIGLFSPIYKGDNNYRYYDYSQSIELEYILMLKELHMSLKRSRNIWTSRIRTVSFASPTASWKRSTRRSDA